MFSGGLGHLEESTRFCNQYSSACGCACSASLEMIEQMQEPSVADIADLKKVMVGRTGGGEGDVNKGVALGGMSRVEGNSKSRTSC